MPTNWVLAGEEAEIRQKGVKVIPGSIAVFAHEDNFYAVENRCPHMGFPLHMGSLCNGILTCHWHHARFDVCSGGTLDPFADDVPAHQVKVENGEVWVDPLPKTKKDISKHFQRLREGLEQNISLVIAKSVIALIEAGVSEVEIAKVGVAFGTAERAAGWGPGLTILTAMVNVLPKLDAYGRILALSQGLAHVARDCAGQSTRHMLQSLPTTNFSLERLAAWYRECVEVRDTQGAERVLLTAIEKGADENQLADMMLVAATDHFYLNGGHTFDFHNKAFEMLEHVGEAQRKTTLTSLVPLLANPSRSEESQNWNAPVNLVKPLQEAFRELPEIVNDMQLVKAPELDEAQFVNQILSDDPLATVQVISQTLKRGVLPARVAQLVALAAAERITRFHIQNDFGDWIAVLHTFTHAHAVHERLLRGTDALAIRAIYYTAMRIYLDRFLNIPPARRPGTGKQAPQAYSTQPEELLELMDQRQQVSEAANWVANYLNNNGDVDALLNTLGHTLLREDAEFHSFQMYEAALNEYERWASVDSPMSECAKETMLFALTRYLAAHAPTARELPHVVRIAWRLQRGEKLFEEK